MPLIHFNIKSALLYRIMGTSIAVERIKYGKTHKDPGIVVAVDLLGNCG